LSIEYLPLLVPAPLALAALAGFFVRGTRPRRFALFAECAAVLSGLAALAMLGGAFAAVWGPAAGSLSGSGGQFAGLDAVSLAMLLLVAFIGWVVVRFSRTYLDGEQRQGVFTGWLCFSLTAVMLLVSAGHLGQLFLAWVATSLGLQRLLLFYPARLPAQRAARKEFLTARAGDVALGMACLVLLHAYGTGDIHAILAAARNGEGGPLAAFAAALLGVAAALKSAQFPAHGWLTEVMETPTPVSALLHAGIINGGGFLLVRFADVMLLAPGVMAALVLLGGFTALFGSLVMLTQPTVKTSLAWSTVAQMGFMIFECGLGLFSLALLHILAHSLYKAHSFLASGGAVERIAAFKRPGPVAIPNARAVGRAFLAAFGLYVLIGFSFGFHHKSPQAIAVGTILILGVAYMLAQGFASAAPRALTWRTALYAIASSLAYFGLQMIMTALTASALPPVPQAGTLEWVLIVLAVGSFGAIAVVQAMFPLWAHHPAALGLYVHLSNGLYANAVFDRMMASWRRKLS
jgi:NAD(P)H-quinone oxidoreductase subunit 5